MPSGPNNLGDYLQRKASQLDLGRGDELKQIQDYLDARFRRQVRALSTHNGTLTVTTPNSSMATELRYAQMQIRADLKEDITDIKKLVIKIR